MNQPTERTRKIYRVTWIGMVVNIALSLLKLAAGILGRSGAMIADAVHSISDLATDVIVLIFARISSKPEDAGHNYGHGKYETLASILIRKILYGVYPVGSYLPSLPELAERYGADVEKARVAALLHDCTKKLNMEEQLELCGRYGIQLDELEQKALKLLHAKTGAAIARDVFGVDDEIYNAIWWHTTGHAHMTLLEKVIYLADYIEPSRNFPGVDKLRAVCYKDLDEGLLMGLEMTIEEMTEMGNPVHHATIEARDALKG